MQDELDSHNGDPAAEAAAPEGQRYTLLNCIGVGAKSDSFLVRDSFQEGRQLVRRLFHENFTQENKDLMDLTLAPLAGLSHPNLPKIIDFGVEDAKAFLIRERVEGVKLSEALSGAPRQQALALIGQLVLALDYLFSQNILHLALKPENLLVDKNANPWRLKVLDFGLSPVFYPPTKVESNAVGTPPYTAPEYAIRRTLDVRSDLYSVGIYLFLALAGRFPFDGKETVTLLQAQLKKDPIPLSSVVPGISSKLNVLVQRLLARDPQSRYGTPRQACAALLEAADDPQLPSRVFYPEVFSDPDDVFRYQEYLKLFRRIALQGGRWAISGEKGSGKSFLARWLERLFWLNQKPVLRIPGPQIALLEGEHSLNPSEPTYLIVDDADKGPVEAWLRARPYAHIVTFVQDKAWTQNKSGWQLYPLKPLDPKQMGSVLERDLSLAGERMVQEWVQRTKGEPGWVVHLGRAMTEREIIRPAGLHHKMEAEKFLTVPREAAVDPAITLGEGPRKILTLLTFVQVPIRADLLAAWAQRPMEEVEPTLNHAMRRDWVGRLVALGQEFFESRLPFSPPVQARVPEADAKALLGELERLEWYQGGLSAFDRYFGAERPQDHGLILLRSRLACGAGNHGVVFKSIDSNLVNALKPQQKGDAFETLGRALLASGKYKQADPALKNAYKAHQTQASPDGMARSLMYLGMLHTQEHDTEKALRFYQQALTEAEKSRDREAIEGAIELHIGDLYAAATDFENAEARYTIALQRLGYSSQEATIAQVYANYAKMAWQMGDETRAELLALEGLRRATFMRRFATQGEIFSTLARIQEPKGNLRGAAERLAEAIHTFSLAGHSLDHLRALIERALFYERNRELILASQDAQEALKEAKRLGQGDLEGQALLVLGKVMRRDINRFEQAIEHLDHAYQKLAEAKDVRMAWECLFEKGEIERYRENYPAAKTFYQQALKLLDHALGQAVPGTAPFGELQQKRSQVEMIVGSLG